VLLLVGQHLKKKWTICIIAVDIIMKMPDKGYIENEKELCNGS